MKDLWHKSLVYFGFADEEYPPETAEEEDDDGAFLESAPSVRKINRNSDVGRSNRATLRPVQEVPQAKVHVVEPKSFNDAQRVADKFKIDIPVIMNLQQADKELSKRVIDFASGLTYALDGSLQRVAEKVFLLTPKNTAVSAEEKRRLQEKGFFNQS
ncbi:MAG: cell division protein SepF [Actinobacteria bacterium]|nr:MAG: cell division protein SepF [Actinomycetota bacterium]